MFLISVLTHFCKLADHIYSKNRRKQKKKQVATVGIDDTENMDYDAFVNYR